MSTVPTNILVLGATGMLGNAILRYLNDHIAPDGRRFTVVGTARSPRSADLLQPHLRDLIVTGIDVGDIDSLTRLFADTRPDAVINCVGVVKQLAAVDDPLISIPINTILPHRLAQLSALGNARFVHMSTDCVFSGAKGMYRETDHPDCHDLYGRSKLLGEVDYPNSITLRTSIIGHELDGSNALLNWFLAQSGEVKGYSKAIFSGLPTVEIARVIRDYILPKPELHGTYHVSAEPIVKFDLLKLIGDVYGHRLSIVPDDRVNIDRSLDSSRFRSETGYVPPSWPNLIEIMRKFG